MNPDGILKKESRAVDGKHAGKIEKTTFFMLLLI